MIYLKRAFIILVINLSVFTVKAQQIHFVYVQTENGEPFYIKMNNKIVSSSSSGYLILPNLTDGEYQIVVGFPKNEFPEEGFHFSIDKKNEGFLLKNFGEKGWGLFNLQSLELLSGSTSTNSNTVASPPAKIQNDEFTNMLANVVKDSSILQKSEPEVPVKDTLALPKNEPTVAAKDTPVLQNNILATDTSANKIAEQNPPVLPIPSITKLLSKNDKEGTQMVYVDKNDSNNDTVRVFIPAEKVENKKAEDAVPINDDKNSNAPAKTDTSQLTITPTVVNPDNDTVTLVNDTIKITKERAVKDAAPQVIKDSAQTNNATPTLVMSVDTPGVKSQNVEIGDSASVKNSDTPKAKNTKQKIFLPKVITSSKVNSDCRAFATDDDFLKLRKKMAAENSDDEMLGVAKKVFHTKCFSTEQIKNLSFLFLTDGGKYTFFDAAYAFASDSDQYSSLVSQLTDTYYINRFKAMIHN